MELCLKPSEIACYMPCFSQTVRKEETMDSVVPDSMPDIGEILCTSGNILIRSKDVGEGRVRLEANIPARIGYAPEEGEGCCCLEVNLPVYLSLEDEAITEQSLCVTELSLAALETKILNPRKISVRAEALCSVACYQPSSLSFSGLPAQGVEGINLLERQVAITPVCAVTEKTFVLTDEFTIPAASTPPAALLGQSIQLQVEELKPVGTKLIVKGSAKSALLYTMEDMTVGALDFTSAFSQIVELDTLPEDSFSSVRLLLSGAYYDLAAADRQAGAMELHIVAQVLVYGPAEPACLVDAYSNRYALNVVQAPRTLTRILRSVSLKETLREPLTTPVPVAEILQGSYVPGSVQTAEGTVTVPIAVSVYYRDSGGALGSVSRTLTLRFTQKLEEGESLEAVDVTGQELYLAPTASGMELRLTLEIRAFLWKSDTLLCIQQLEYNEAEVMDLSDRPTLVILRAASGDDLWALAKEHVSTVEAIRQANGLDQLTGSWEKLLLIPKTV